MSARERRNAPRKQCAVPMRLRFMNSTGSMDTFEGQTQNLSETGVYFTASRRMKVGDPIEMFFTLPRELTGRRPEPVRCQARVVHVKPVGNNGHMAAGAAIDRFEQESWSDRWGN